MIKFYKSLSPFKRRYIPIFSAMAVLLIVSIVLVFVFPTITHQIMVDPSNRSKSGWPTRLSAPYIDMSGWVDPTSAYSINGAPNLGLLSDDSGFSYFNLGFIQPATDKPLESDGNIRWGWGGYYSLSKNAPQNAQYNGIVESLKSLRAKGGDFAISIGGQIGDAPWVVTQNQTALENFYLDIIGTYELKRLDLDIEESNQDQDQNIINARAVKAVQDKTGVEITLTIPIMPHGWEQKQINIINAYLDAGVNIHLINSMTMCYGTGVWQNEDYGSASVRAITNSIRQMKTIYANHGYELTDDQAYLKTGATFSIGYESSLYPVFTLSMANTVVDDAIKHNYGMVSMWSMGRDAMLISNQAITTKFNYSEVLHRYDEDVSWETKIANFIKKR